MGSRQCGQNLFGYDLICGKNQGAERNRALLALQVDLSDAASRLIGVNETHTAKQVVEVYSAQVYAEGDEAAVLVPVAVSMARDHPLVQADRVAAE
ncbi:MAG TPA: hypothetical protein VN788_00245 [Verrucomicrobiae bacterium]|nr:hypothetical protein [Verrucomicrobiae bacterium]